MGGQWITSYFLKHVTLYFTPFVVFLVQSQSHVWFCDPRDCRTPGFPVLHYLPELAQTHVHRVSDAILPSHPLSPSPPPSIPPSIRVYSNVSTLRIRWPEYWSFSFSIRPSNEHSGLSSFRIDLFDHAVQGTLKESSPTPQFKSINSLALSFFHSLILTSIHDRRKSHSLD